MLDGLFSWLFPPKKPKIKVEISKPPLFSSSSFVYTRNGKTVYEERDGKVITGTPADKAEGEKVAADISASTNQMIDDMQKNMDSMFNDMKKTFGPGFPFKKP